MADIAKLKTRRKQLRNALADAQDEKDDAATAEERKRASAHVRRYRDLLRDIEDEIDDTDATVTTETTGSDSEDSRDTDKRRSRSARSERADSDDDADDDDDSDDDDDDSREHSPVPEHWSRRKVFSRNRD